MAKRKVKVGIIGCGGYGGTARKYVRNTNRFDIVACMDINEKAAREAAELDGAKSYYTDIDDLLNHEGLEAVCINTPVLLHAEHSMKALEAGKHVFITKPVTNSIKEAEKIKAFAQKQNLAYMVAHHARHMPEAILEKEIIQSGKLGKVCNALATCCSSAGLEQKEGDWRTVPGQNPGGPMLQCGIHTIDHLLGIFGSVKRVMSIMQDNITPFDVIDNTVTLLDFKCGVQVTFVSNYTTAYMHSRDYFGTKGNLHTREHISGLGQKEMYLQPRARGDHEPWEALRISSKDRKYPDAHGGILEKGFADQILKQKYDYSNLDDAIEALKIIEAAEKSHKTGKAVEL